MHRQRSITIRDGQHTSLQQRSQTVKVLARHAPLIHEPSLRSDTFIEDQITADILACGHALCLLGQPLDICERAEITSGLAARQAPGIGVFGCAVEGELTRDPAPIIVLALGWCDWTIFLLPSKNMKSIKSLVSKTVFSQVFGEGARSDFENPKVPPGGSHRETDNFNRRGRACAHSSNGTSMGRWAAMPSAVTG